MTVTSLPRNDSDPRDDDPGWDRTPPNNVAAEQCVLGGMLLSKDAISDVIDVIRPADHYRPAHQIVHEAILDLYGRGEPVDAITVAAELTRTGLITKMGGAPYLHTLIASVPTAANAGYYAEIVKDQAILRRVAEAGTDMVRDAYAGKDASTVLDRAQAAVYAAGDQRGDGDLLQLAEVLPFTLEDIEATGLGTKPAGIPTGFADLDELLGGGLHGGQCVLIAGRPGLGKSCLADDFARSAALRHGLPAVLFSLEMPRNEIVMRIIAAEARVPMHLLRTGKLSDDDWRRIAVKMGEVSDAPLFIDDSPGLTLMEIRAKCRRLKQKHGLRLVLIDYLQLMPSARRGENRQQEVSEMSRGLKLLAKELDVPVVALSQLNRGPEQRQDHRPFLSDLRESGCLTADTTLLRADTGAPISFQELMDTGHEGVLVWSLDEHRRLVPAPVTNVFSSGVKEVFRLRLRSGREVKATANHRFLTFSGWTALGDLQPGDRLAVPRHIPEPVAAGPGWAGQRLTRIADLLDSDMLRGHASGDVFWDRVVSIESLGTQPVYDATVKGTHNFVADGIVAHNSLEQDADVVILLHREDAYEREFPRAEEADLIVAKHRNGNTATITVAFQGHYSRFADMAPVLK